MINFVSVRVGSKYNADYVHILHDMLSRNCSNLEQRHWCITDDPDSVPDYVTPIGHDPALPGWWQKVGLFAPRMPWSAGDRIAYFDLDVAITGRLEDLVERKGIIRDELWPCYNSSVMVWDHGEHQDIWSLFDPTSVDKPGNVVPVECLPRGQVNGGDQEWITQVSRWDTFPASWCVSYKTKAREWPPADAKVVIFNGDPKPAQCDGWVPNVWKIGGYTSLPKMTGVNTSNEVIWSNIETNLKRDLPWFLGALPHRNTAVLVCGGPSLKDSIQSIRDHKRRGARIITVNNAMRYLMEQGIEPDVHVMLDARPENAEFVRDAPEGPQYFLASQVHPDVFEALKDRQVTVWHNAVGDGEEMDKAAEPYVTEERPLIQVPGGCTVGLRGMWLAFFSGYRKLHIYGMDGSYEGDTHHAYPQSLNDGEDLMQVAMGERTYMCSKWMVRQADEFHWCFAELTKMGMQIFVHGRGLIPDKAKAMREEMRAAA